MSGPRKAKILLVDDTPANLLALRAVLDAPDYDIVEADSGPAAIELCNQHEFALILLDIQMPVMDGYQTALRIKQGKLNCDVPIIFVTAVYREDPFVKRGYEVGAIDYFGKPFEPDILKAKVGIYTDLYLKTKRLQETEELLKTHDQIKALLEAMPVGVIIADTTGEVYEANDVAERIWGGIRRVGLAGYGIYEGHRSETGERLGADDWAIARALTEGATVKDEIIEIEAFDGKRRTILQSAFPIRGKTGQVLGAIAVIQDMTARKYLADDIKEKAYALLNDALLLDTRSASS